MLGVEPAELAVGQVFLFVKAVKKTEDRMSAFVIVCSPFLVFFFL